MPRPVIKNLVKPGVKRAVWVTGSLIRPTPNRSVILTYHSVGARNHEMNVTPEDFRAQIQWLSTHGPVISLDDAAEAKPGVAITFDDGFRDNLTHAAPALRDLGLQATVFVVTGRVGGHLDDEPDPEHGRIMTWDEIRAIEYAGFTVGAHTKTHRRLAALPRDAQRDEIAGSKARLESELGHAVRHFAYPYGSASDYDGASMELVRETGFQCACSNRYGVNSVGADRWQLRRIWVDATDSLPLFRAKVLGQLDGLRHLEGDMALRVRRWLNRR